jgi:hypothetical protein
LATALGNEAGVLRVRMSERTREKGGSGVFIWCRDLGDRREWSWRSGLGVAKLGGGVLVRGLRVRGARGFGRMRVSRGAEAGMPTVQSHLRMQVFDGELGGLTGERRRGAAPVGPWGGAELECMVEIDRRCAWGGKRDRVQNDMAGTGWG